jgi:hypothetical protein
MKPLKLNLVWLRGQGEIDFSRPNVFYNLGARGAGKSALLELFASRYLDHGGKVIDLFGSKDGEALAWLRSPYAKERKVILLRGDLVEVKSGHENIAASKFRASDLDRGDIFVSAAPLYESMDAEFDGVNRIINVLWSRRNWTVPFYAVMREAANLMYSRIKIRNNQMLAKAETLYMMRESRHVGLALGLDSIKHTSIDVDIRVLTDYLIIKSTGMHGLPRDLWWVYNQFDPVQMRRLKAREFIIVDRHGHLGFGTFDLPPWHKEEREDIVKETGIELNYLLPAAEGDQVREFIREALNALPPEPSVENVVAWVKDQHNIEVRPNGVGSQLRILGYHTERIYKEGRPHSIIKKLP